MRKLAMNFAFIFSLIVPSICIAHSLIFQLDDEYASITEIYLSPSTSDQWGKPRYEKLHIFPEYRIQIDNIDEGKWDVRLLINFNKECILTNVEVEKNTIFSITEEFIDQCKKIK